MNVFSEQNSFVCRGLTVVIKFSYRIVGLCTAGGVREVCCVLFFLSLWNPLLLTPAQNSQRELSGQAISVLFSHAHDKTQDHTTTLKMTVWAHHTANTTAPCLLNWGCKCGSRPARSASPENLLKKYILRSDLRPPESETLGVAPSDLYFNKSSRWSSHPLKFENHCLQPFLG